MPLSIGGSYSDRRALSTKEVFLSVLPTEEDRFELFEVEAAVACFVVLDDHIVHLSAADLLAQFLHGEHDILLCNLTGGVSIELVEHSSEARICKELLDIDGSGEEFRVVDLLVIVIVHLTNHFTDLGIANVHFLGHEDIVKLLSSDHTSAIFVDSLELSSKILHLILRSCLNKKIHGGFFES